MPRGPKDKVVEISKKEYKALRGIVANVWKSEKYNGSVAKFETVVRSKAAELLDLSEPLPPVYRQTISALRYEMTDLRTSDEQLGLTQRPRKPGIGIRVKRSKPPKVVILNKGKAMELDSHKDVLQSSTATLGPNLYPTFGPSSDIQIFTSGTPTFESPKLFFGPLLPPSEALPSIFSGPMTQEPTGVQPPQNGWKEVDWQEITPSRLKTWSGRSRNDYGGQQNGIMGGVSAANEARYALSVSSGMPDEVKKLDENDWEWLHLVAFSMGGIENVPQQAKNLVAGSYHANTEMMLYENGIKKLVEETGESLWVQVKAHVIMHTHVADQIFYTIERRQDKQAPRSLKFETKPLAFNVPAKDMEAMVYAAMKKELFG
jgi:hypothetical protein